MHVFKHPKYYKELRKRNRSSKIDGPLSNRIRQLAKNGDGWDQRSPGPGLKPQASSGKRQASAGGKPQAASLEKQASSPEEQASSLKP